MNSESGERIIQKLDRAVVALGAPSYEHGMQQFGRLISFLKMCHELIETKEALRKTLEKCEEFTPLEKLFINMLSDLVPVLARSGVQSLLSDLDVQGVQLPSGRPTPTALTKQQVCEFITQKIFKGASTTQAKSLAAKRFTLSARQIQTIWSARGEESKLDLGTALQMLNYYAEEYKVSR